MKLVKVMLLGTFLTAGTVLAGGCSSKSTPESKATSHMDSVRQSLEKTNQDLDAQTQKLEASLEKLEKLSKTN